jgi:hypothetical protein
MIDFWARPNRSLLYWLWAQHNEHRIVLPKLLLLLDYHGFHGRDIFLLVMNMLVQLAVVATVLWTLYTWEGLRGAAWRTAAGIALLCAFCASQWENLSSGFQISLFLVNFLFVLGVILLLCIQQYGKRAGSEWKQAGGAVLVGLAASYSAANGILIWPILILIALVQRLRRHVLILLSASAVAAVATYMYHYQSPPYHSNPFTSIRHPAAVLAYLASYLGAPLDWNHPNLALVFGGIGLMAAGLASIMILYRWPHRPTLVLLSSVFLFAIGSGVMTALGRLKFGPDQALSSRYETLGLCFWFAIGALLLSFLAKRTEMGLLVFQCLLVLIMVAAGMRLTYPLKTAQQRALGVNTASLALVAGVNDPGQISTLFPAPDLPWRDLPFLAQQRWSVFATRLAAEWEKPLREVYHLRPQPCWGAVDRVVRINAAGGEGYRVSGWSWDPLRRRSPHLVIFVAAGKIVGYAQPGYPRPDLHRVLASRSAADAGWVGYVKPMPPASAISVYSTVNWRGDQTCQVTPVPPGFRSPVPPIQFSAYLSAK